TLLECIRIEGDATADTERALQLFFEAGQIYEERLRDLPKAVETFQKILSRAPRHHGAFQRLEAIYGNQNAYQALFELNQLRAKAIESADEQAELYLGAAKLAQDKIKDANLALGMYREVLARQPKNSEALVRVGPLLVDAGAKDEAIDVFHRVVTQGAPA